ncbi:MAG: ssl1498 family light-harvesting-like protein [Goleter apudmare HA4340-LM2]|jgi:hypothetical protein|nr:ssl1498 family light-harvesting-like protein [Goleter apudmare HA4340-LM2]
MRDATNDRGTLNHYSVEPVVYVAEYPNQEQQYRYAFQEAIAVMLIFSALTVVVVS